MVGALGFLLVAVAVVNADFVDEVDNNGPEWVPEEPPQPEHAVRRAIPGPAKVEVLAVVDYQLGRKLKTKGSTWARQYLANYYNAVNMRYQTIKEFKITVVLSGIYYCKSENECDFLTKHKVGQYVAADKAIEPLRQWLYARKDTLPKHDVAMVHTYYDLCSGSRTCYSSTSGWAYIGTTCGQPDRRGYMWNCGIVEDYGSFGGTVIGAHELAHTLGVKHDGTDVATSCAEKSGYIMGKRSGTNGYLFSSCSIAQMKTFLEKSSSSCVYKTNGAVITANAKYPGEFINADTQCKNNYGSSSKACWSDSRVCEKLGCAVPHPNGGSGLYCRWKGGAVDGTACASNKICNGGRCVTRT